jgi:hypothetical protein
MSKVTQHPNTRLLKKIEELEKQNKLITLDLLIVRDLILRTIRIIAKQDMAKPLVMPEKK